MIGTTKFIAMQILVFAVATGGAFAQPGPADPNRGPMSGSRGTMMPMPGRTMGPSSVGYPPSQGSSGQPTRFGSMPGGDTRVAPSGYNGSRQYTMPDHSRPGSRSSLPANIAPPDTSRMQNALREKNFNRLEQETQGVRNRANSIENIGPGLPVEDRIKLPLLNHMYKRGADTVDEGSSSRDENKIRMGLQQINQANEKYGRLESELQRPQGSSPDNPGNGRNGSRSGKR